MTSNAGAMADRPLAIEARGLIKRFDGFTAVDGVDISVPEGSIYGILGPNGAGKTTTLRMLLGIIDPDEGIRRVLGHDRPHEIAHMIGYLPEERGLYPAMKAYEAIGFLGALRSFSSVCTACSSAAIAEGICSGVMMPLGEASLPMIASTRLPLGSSMIKSPVTLDLNLKSMSVLAYKALIVRDRTMWHAFHRSIACTPLCFGTYRRV